MDLKVLRELCEPDAYWSHKDRDMIHTALPLLLDVAGADKEIDKIVSLGDYIYDVREREGKGWEGPKVKAYSDAISKRMAALRKLEGKEGG